MLNRPHPAGSDALDARRAMQLELREKLKVTPASPFDWKAFDPVASLSAGVHSPDLRLANLARLLCTAPSRSAELRAMWKECVLTAAFALRLGPRLGGDAATSAIAGLLHRLGDLLTLQAIASIEHATHLRLDAAGKAQSCAEHGPGLLERVVRAWEVPPRAAATATGWRRLREFPSAAADAASVYLARLLAVERISPDFCAPGIVEHAIEEMGLQPDSLADLRSDPAIAVVLESLP